MTETDGNWSLSFDKLDKRDEKLIQAAISILKVNFHPVKHQIGCALLTKSGNTYSSVNIESSGYGPHAEAIAIGIAISKGEKDIIAIVAVKKIDDKYPVISPCGNCRQLIIDYAHDAHVILDVAGQNMKARASELLPNPYENSLTAIARSSRLSSGQ